MLVAVRPVLGVDAQAPPQPGGAAAELLVQPVAGPTDGLSDGDRRRDDVEELRRRQSAAASQGAGEHADERGLISRAPRRRAWGGDEGRPGTAAPTARVEPAVTVVVVCMSCVASGAPMVTVGLTVMRRRALKAWFMAAVGRLRRVA